MKINITEQLILKGQAPLDAKLTPVNNVSDLYLIPRTDRYLGMTVVVLNTGTQEDPCEYWLPKTTSDLGWVKKESGGYIDLSDYYTSAQTDNAISEALESFTGGTTSAETQELIEAAMAIETARTETTYLKEHQSLTDYYTSAQTDNAIAEALEEFTGGTTSAETQQLIEAAMAIETARTETTYLKEHQSLIDYYTSAQTDSAISNSLEDYGAEINYDSGTTKVQLKNAEGVVLSEFDAAVFIKDGMLSSVTVEEVLIDGVLTPCLVMTFNTDAGSRVINLPISEIFHAENYYDKNEVDELMAAETARTETTYLKEHQSLADYYTSAQTDDVVTTAIAAETARTETTYLKEHQSLADYYTSAQTESAITSAITEVTEIVYENERIVTEAFLAETARTETTYLKPVSLLNYATKQYVNDAISGISTSAETQHLIDTAMAQETARTETTYLKPESLTNYYTSGETNSQIDSALTNYMTITDLNEIFSTLEKKPAVVYEHDTDNPIHGQTGNLFTATVWHTLADADLTNYSRLRIYVNPSTHSVDSSTNNTAAAIFEISLDNSSLTTNVQYYTGGVVVPCLNYDNRLYSIAAMVRNENNAWQIAFKTISLYGTSSTDITDSYIYKIEGIFKSSYNLINPVTTYSGSGLPNPQDGNNGDIYLQTE